MHVFPWVVGFRGFIDPAHLGALLSFLRVPRPQWRVAAERSALASVRALYFMHRVRVGGARRNGHEAMGLEDGANDDEDDAPAGRYQSRKRARAPTLPTESQQAQAVLTQTGPSPLAKRPCVRNAGRKPTSSAAVRPRRSGGVTRGARQSSTRLGDLRSGGCPGPLDVSATLQRDQAEALCRPRAKRRHMPGEIGRAHV